MRIMIVDDQTGIRSMLKEIIDLEGVGEVEFVESSSEDDILDIYRSSNPDFVLLATELKVMSGFKLAQNLMDTDHDAKIVLMSTFDVPAFRTKAEELQVTGFILKESLQDVIDIIKA